MDRCRNFKNISRHVLGARDDGQGLNHFMSESPWEVRPVYDKIQKEIAAHPELSGGVLIVDESAEARNDGLSAGVSRQHNGRLGKVDCCQVGVGLSYYRAGMWTLVDSGLFMPQKWFDDEHKKLWDRLRIPKDLSFRTKIEMARDMIFRARENGLSFSLVCFDELYGGNKWLRAELAAGRIIYVGHVPRDTLVYPEEPALRPPKKRASKK
jgi:SRSO17 transposase